MLCSMAFGLSAVFSSAHRQGPLLQCWQERMYPCSSSLGLAGKEATGREVPLCRRQSLYGHRSSSPAPCVPAGVFQPHSVHVPVWHSDKKLQEIEQHASPGSHVNYEIGWYYHLFRVSLRKSRVWKNSLLSLSSALILLSVFSVFALCSLCLSICCFPHLLSQTQLIQLVARLTDSL